MLDLERHAVPLAVGAGPYKRDTVDSFPDVCALLAQVCSMAAVDNKRVVVILGGAQQLDLAGRLVVTTWLE